MLPEFKNCSIIDINTLTLTKRSYFILNFRMQKLLMQFLVLYSGIFRYYLLHLFKILHCETTYHNKINGQIIKIHKF